MPILQIKYMKILAYEHWDRALECSKDRVQCVVI